jgi:hypothetical protein
VTKPMKALLRSDSSWAASSFGLHLSMVNPEIACLLQLGKSEMPAAILQGIMGAPGPVLR